MEYHEIHNFIHQEKLRNLSNTPSAIDEEDFDDSSDSGPNTPLDHHLKKTHHHARHYYQASVPIHKKERSWWPFVSARAEEPSPNYHPHDAIIPRKHHIERPRPFLRPRLANRSFYTRRPSTSKRGRVRRRLVWTLKRQPQPQQPQRQPSAPTVKKSKAAQSPDPPATIISPSTLIHPISNQIHTLQCLIEIQIQSIEDHQRDIGFYTDRLDQLQQDVKYLNRKVLGVLSTMENQMDPIHDQIQRTILSLIQLHRSHGIIVTGFMTLVQRKRTNLDNSQARVVAAQLQIARWDTITFWTWLIVVTTLVSLFLWWMITFAGWFITFVFVTLLVWLFYDTA